MLKTNPRLDSRGYLELHFDYEQLFSFTILTVWLLFFIENIFFNGHFLYHLGTGGYLPCPIYKITGIQCPGCGMTRSFISLSRYELYNSFTNNPFGVGLFGYLMIQISPFRKKIMIFFNSLQIAPVLLALILIWWFFSRLLTYFI